MLRREGRERRIVREIRDSILVVGGRSESVTGGRKVWLMWRRTVVCAAEGGPLVGMMTLTERLWLLVSLLANSIIGIRCPMPGLGIKATKGVRGCCCCCCWSSMAMMMTILFFVKQYYGGGGVCGFGLENFWWELRGFYRQLSVGVVLGDDYEFAYVQFTIQSCIRKRKKV